MTKQNQHHMHSKEAAYPGWSKHLVVFSLWQDFPSILALLVAERPSLQHVFVEATKSVGTVVQMGASILFR